LFWNPFGLDSSSPAFSATSHQSIYLIGDFQSFRIDSERQCLLSSPSASIHTRRL